MHAWCVLKLIHVHFFFLLRFTFTSRVQWIVTHYRFFKLAMVNVKHNIIYGTPALGREKPPSGISFELQRISNTRQFVNVYFLVYIQSCVIHQRAKSVVSGDAMEIWFLIVRLNV